MQQRLRRVDRSWTRRMTEAALLAACAGGGAGLWGCEGPLGERPEDSGRHVGLSRLRDVQPLRIEQFKATTEERPAAGGAEGGGGNAAQTQARPRSRFEGVERVELTRERCRAEALANNLDLRVSLVDPLIAGESLRAERAKFEAVFQPFARFRNDDRPTLQTTSANQQEVLSLGAGVDIPLRTGGRVSVDYAQSRTESGQAIFTASQLFSSDATVSISQPLLRNAGRGATTASIQIAGYGQQQAEARTKLAVISQVAATDRGYWRLYAARRALEVVQQQYELAVEQLGRAERRVRAGDAADLEVTRAQSGVAQRLEAIVTAENDVLIAQRALKRVMNMAGLDVDTQQSIVPATDPTPAPYEFDSARLMELALGERMELLDLELQLLADAASEGFQRNQVLPLLNLDASYTWSGLGSSFNSGNGSFAEGNFQSYALGLTGDIPIGNEAAEARLKRATLTRIQRIGSRQAREQTVRQEVLDAVDRVRAGWQRILAARQASILAGRTLEGERRQFDQGARTSTDVLDAASSLAQAQLAEIRALADYEIAQVDLAVATGTTLGAGLVSWSPTTADLPDGGPRPEGSGAEASTPAAPTPTIPPAPAGQP